MAEETILGDGSTTATTVEGTADWKSSLPIEIREEASLKSIKDIPSLAKSYISAQGMIGKTLRPPAPDAKPEEWNAFYGKLGRPESPEKYTKLDYSQLPAGMKVDEKYIEHFYQKAHENGLTDRQARGILQSLHEKEMESAKAEQASFSENRKGSLDLLKKEFGKAFSERLGMAQKAYKELVNDDDRKVLEEIGFGDHPAVVKLFARLGAKMVEDHSIDGSARVSMVMTPEEAMSKINEVKADLNHPYNNKKFYGTPERAQATKDMERLFNLAYPSA